MVIGATMPVRNEAWSIGLSIRAVLAWVDFVVVLDHASTDATPRILGRLASEFRDRLIVLNESDPVWNEMHHRQRLLEAARGNGATHIAIVDADEVLAGDSLRTIRPAIAALHAGEVLQPFWAHLWRGLGEYRSDKWAAQYASIAFRDAPGLHWEARNGYHFHHRSPFGATDHRPAPSSMALMHLQHASWRRLLAKQALYQLTEVDRWPGREPVDTVRAKYSRTVDESGLRTTPVPKAWWEPYADFLKHLDLDEDPWQETEVRRICAESPKLAHGLDMFGVASI
jgi:hypothetical protein